MGSSKLLKATRIFAVLILVTVAMPFAVAAQNRGLGKKCEKFENCHDARDGKRYARNTRHYRSNNWNENGRHHHRRYSSRYHRNYDRNR